jgi:hypothetical protein
MLIKSKHISGFRKSLFFQKNGILQKCPFPIFLLYSASSGLRRHGHHLEARQQPGHPVLRHGVSQGVDF